MRIQRAAECRGKKVKKFWFLPAAAEMDRSGYTRQWNWLFWNFQWKLLGNKKKKEKYGQ